MVVKTGIFRKERSNSCLHNLLMGGAVADTGELALSHTHTCTCAHTHTRIHTHTYTDGLPGPVTYNATSDTNASIYVTWSPPSIPNTHPLLLQYEVVTIATSEGFRGSSGLLPAHVTHFVVSGLNGGSEYEICVVAYSLVGQGERGPHISAYTFANGTYIMSLRANYLHTL